MKTPGAPSRINTVIMSKESEAGFNSITLCSSVRKMGLEEIAAATTIMANINKAKEGKNEKVVINGKNF